MSRGTPVSTPDRDVLRQAASVLLGYPDATLRARLPLVRRALAALPTTAAATALSEVCAYIASTPELDVGAHYVRTFDLRRRRTLHMTYYADGDTRRRGHALARIKEIYAGCGWAADSRELPDHLAVLLEFAARCDPEWGESLLLRFRPGMELLRSALREHGTPYAAVLDAVDATLPAAAEAERAAARRLARVGPPVENVGLAAYGAPTAMDVPGGGA